MNDGASPGKPSGFLLGKEFIIVIVIVFSGLSFTLGFFVGKNSINAAREPALQAVDRPAAPGDWKLSHGVSLREAARTEAPAQQPLHVAANEPLNIKDAPGPAAAISDAKTVPELKQKEEPNAGISQKSSARVPARTPAEKQASAHDTSPAGAEQHTSFTVQIGAFKSPADARRLKDSFEQKGLKTYIEASKDAKGRTVYKVRTGEYREKKEADVLALKLRKTEGLHTYVTSKTE